MPEGSGFSRDLNAITELMEHLLQEHFKPRVISGMVWRPATDVYETEKEFVVRMDLAGLKREDLRIVLEEGCLIISGIRQDRIPKGRKHFHKMEITVGPFERRIPVPRGWEVGEVKARYVDGVLQVILEKSTRKEHGVVHVKVE
jgi:HSP20 family protein